MNLSALTFRLPVLADPCGGWSPASPFRSPLLAAFVQERAHIRNRAAIKSQDGVRVHFPAPSARYVVKEMGLTLRRLAHGVGRLAVHPDGTQALLFLNAPLEDDAASSPDWILAPVDIALHRPGTIPPDPHRLRADWAQNAAQHLIDEWSANRHPYSTITHANPQRFSPSHPYLARQEDLANASTQRSEGYNRLSWFLAALPPMPEHMEVAITSIQPGPDRWMPPALEFQHSLIGRFQHPAAPLDAAWMAQAKDLWAQMWPFFCAGFPLQAWVRYGTLPGNHTNHLSGLITLTSKSPAPRFSSTHEKLAFHARVAQTLRHQAQTQPDAA